MRNIIGIIGVLALAACGSPQRSVGGGESVPALQRDYPALAWAPADVTYVATGELGDMSFALKEIATPLELAPGQAAMIGPAFIESAFRGLIGVSPLDPGDLAEIGLAVDRTAAVFSTGLLPTIALPVEDGDTLQAFLDERRPGENVTMKERDGITVVSWQPGEHIALMYARVDDWLLLHLADPRVESLDEWIDGVRDARSGGGVAAAPDLVDAANTARRWLALGEDGKPAVFGLVRVPKLAAQIEQASRCFTATAGSVEGVVLGIDVTPRSGQAVVGIAVSEEAAAALAAHVAPGAPAGYRGYRDEAGLYADLALDLEWVDRALTANGCPSPPELSYAIVPMREFGIRSGSFAIAQLLLEQLKVQAAGYATLSDRAPIDQLLDEIPGRSLIERTVTLGGVKAKSLDLRVVPKFVYRLTDTEGLVAVGGRSIEAVFSGSGAPDPEGALMLAAGIRPEKMPDLEAALTVIIEQLTPYSASLAKGIAALYSRYEDAGFSLSLVGRTIELRGWMTLAP